MPLKEYKPGQASNWSDGAILVRADGKYCSRAQPAPDRDVSDYDARSRPYTVDR